MIDFLLIGAQKSGTTWISEVLRNHPDIFITPQKELHYYNLKENFAKGNDWYAKHFSSSNGRVSGECTPNYLWVSNGPSNQSCTIKNANKTIKYKDYKFLNLNIPELVHSDYPETKFIVSLRNPVDRAISSYFHAIKKRIISPRKSILDVGGEQGIFGMGFYYSQLKKWFKLFNPNQFLILIYEEDIRINKIQTIKKICNHLEIDKSFTPENIDKKIHKTNSQLYLFLHYYQPFLTKAIFKLFPFVNNFSTSMIKISEEEKKCIYELYKSENDKLQELINRPLDIWSNSKP